jgi:mannose-6-phosphate isomerase-like protein (cupin superfamily)
MKVAMLSPIAWRTPPRHYGPWEWIVSLLKKCRRIIEEKFGNHRMVKEYFQVYRRIIDRERRGEKRPWGGYRVLATEPSFKAKKIWVDPGKRLSYQKHRYRNEHWILIEGKGKATLDGKEIFLKPGDCIDIPRGSAHRIGNVGEDLLSFIEIQRGDDFSENDVIRLEDDYGRADRSPEVNVHEG